MVRGTNKRIIEINDTQNPYFERAVLYVKDSRADSPRKSLESQAQNFLSNIRTPLLHGSKPKFLYSSKGRFWFFALQFLFSAGIGSVITLLFLH